MSCISEKANFSTLLRYAQGWEDPLISAEGMEVGPGKRVMTVCGAGDFALWFLACDAEAVIAVDLNPVQIWALELRVAALRQLDNDEILTLFGGQAGDRAALLDACLPLLSPEGRAYWQGKREDVSCYGAGGVGRFENYFRIFRERVLPLCHSRKTVAELLEPGKTRQQRADFFDKVWNNRRWQMVFKLFFSRQVMAAFGRSRAQFSQASEANLGELLATRVRHALVELDPAENPYLQWILTGGYQTALPPWLTALDAIRERLDRLEVHQASLAEVVDEIEPVDAVHLSDVFEYMPQASSDALFEQLATKLRPGGRLAYWNMAVAREAPATAGLQALDEEARSLHLRDRAFFYQQFHLEEALGAAMGCTGGKERVASPRWIPAIPPAFLNDARALA